MEPNNNPETPLLTCDNPQESQKDEMDVASGNITETDSSLLCDVPQLAANCDSSNSSSKVGHCDSEGSLSDEELKLPNSSEQVSSHDSPPHASITPNEQNSEFNYELTVSEFTNNMRRERDEEEKCGLQTVDDKCIDLQRDFVKETSENSGEVTGATSYNMDMWKDIGNSEVVLTPITVAELQAHNCVTPGAIREENKKLLMKRIAQKKERRLRDANKRKREDNEDSKSDDDEAQRHLQKKLTRPRSAMKRRKRYSICERAKDDKSDSSDSEPVRKRKVVKIYSDADESVISSDGQNNLLDEKDKLNSVPGESIKTEDEKKFSQDAKVDNPLSSDEEVEVITLSSDSDKEKEDKEKDNLLHKSPPSCDREVIILSSGTEDDNETEDDLNLDLDLLFEEKDYDSEETYKIGIDKISSDENEKVSNLRLLEEKDCDLEETYKIDIDKISPDEKATDSNLRLLEEKGCDLEETYKIDIDKIAPDEKEPVSNLRLADFVDREAEVSGEDSGDEADAEADGDVLETLIDDKEISDDDEENLMLHIKQQQNEDEKMTNYLKENLVEDNETSNREKKFYWQNKDEENQDGSDKEEDVNEESQVDIDREKIQFLKTSEETEEDEYKVDTNLKIKKIGQGSQSISKKGPTRKHGSMFGSK